MTIRNPRAFVAQLWDWGFLDRCFSNNIRVTDLDGIVERNGHFLVVEGKGPGVPIPKGQQRMFDVMLKTGLFSVMVIWGNPNQQPSSVWLATPYGARLLDHVTLDSIQQLVRGWYARVNRKVTDL